MTAVHNLPTPALLLDLDILERNLQRMTERTKGLGVALRPHIKTHKCIEIGRRQVELGAKGITVSTLYEAEVFADHGFTDITWAFPVVLNRLPQIERLAEHVRLGVVVDSAEALEALAATGARLNVWIKVDCGYHRAGVDPAGALVLDLARRLQESSTLSFDGLLSHSGHAYHAESRAALQAIAGDERDVMVRLAERMRHAGIDVRAVSVGSTPAMSAVDHLRGVTEARPGNYVFYDYTQVVIGAARPRDCAVSVLASVVSAPEGQAHSVVDAGALALSKDAGRDGGTPPTMGEIFANYAAGTLRDDARLTSLSQEHGIVSKRLAVGERIRILPNHSCLTAACWDDYVVVKGEEVVDRWKVWRGRETRA
jgi:D-serine deaminase-like pyridoxal phosphate-dependent protein